MKNYVVSDEIELIIERKRPDIYRYSFHSENQHFYVLMNNHQLTLFRNALLRPPASFRFSGINVSIEINKDNRLYTQIMLNRREGHKDIDMTFWLNSRQIEGLFNFLRDFDRKLATGEMQSYESN